MNRLRRILPLCLLLVSLNANADPFCSIVCPDGSLPLVKQAATELSGYLERLSRTPVPVVSHAASGDRVVLEITPDEDGLGPEGYRIRSVDAPAGAVVTITGATEQGVLFGAYRLLQEYGIGFYFDGDALPASPPSDFLRPEVDGSPVFAIRGSLPWYNFLNSPTTWDDQDFRFFADQIVRSGQNFIGFHSYDHEPFAAYQYDGQVIGGQPLMTTARRIWGTSPLRVDDFGFGTGRLFPGEYWGSDVARQPGSREERITAAKQLLARGLEYASARGVRTCLGFEVGGDPSNPAEQRRFRARLLQLLKDYPMLDYVWLWQPEGMSMQGSTPPAPRSPAGRLYREWQESFGEIEDPARKWEGIRVATYARLARDLMDHAAPHVKLVLSGWGGDHWLHVSDYFPCWDRVLDKRIIFAALDDIRVGPTVSRNYALPQDRERWAIPWYEYDGDQWFPQANVHIFADTVRDARAKGCQGLLGIHWRTKEVGESQAYVARAAWHPEQTLESFYADYARRRFGEGLAEEMAAILIELDGLGYRWIGGPGQSECGEFAWCHARSPEKQEALADLRERLVAARGRLDETAPSGAVGRLDDLLATLDRGLMFNRIAALMVADGPVDQALDMDPQNPERAQRCAAMLVELREMDFAKMLGMWASTITSRGEMGVLATINGKAFVDYRDKVARLREACGLDADTSDLSAAPDEGSGIISDYQHSSIAAGSPLTVRCAAWDGAGAAKSVALEFATGGVDGWQSIPMANTERCVFEATIPGERVQAGWLRYRIVAQTGSGVLRWPELRGEPFRQVHIHGPGALVSRRNQVDTAIPRIAVSVGLECRVLPFGGVGIRWFGAPGMAEAVIERRTGADDWVRVCESLDRACDDLDVPGDADLEYRLLDDEGEERARSTIRTARAVAPDAPEDLVARAGVNSVRLRWEGDDLRVVRYSVERRAGPDGDWRAVTGAGGVTPQGFGQTGYTDRVTEPGDYSYRVRAVGAGGVESGPSGVVTVHLSGEIPAPLLDLDFGVGKGIEDSEDFEFTGPHDIGRELGRQFLRTNGGLTVPYSDSIAVNDAFTVAVRFRQIRKSPMPVLVCQGAWQAPGYFVQLIGHDLRFYVSGAGCLDARFQPELGRWYTVVCVYDGESLASFVDGRLIGEQPARQPFQPSERHFTVARYDQIGPDWTFTGDIDFVRLYGEAIEPWMVLRGSVGQGAGLELEWSGESVTVDGEPVVWHQQPWIVETGEGRAVDLRGGLTVPFTAWPGDRFEIETRFSLRSLEGMPVLLVQGLWPDEGYMLQVLDRRIRWHVSGVGSLDCGPELDTGRWYRVRCIFDRGLQQVFLDGEKVGESRGAPWMAPSLRPLRVGRYETDEAVYRVDGFMGPVRIAPLSEHAPG
ncbi:MAG: hypothetical protein HPY44_07550 [Armatimonadetes bacterium]|nr:hypothetical protein [Armatimonadota bacterium]